MATFSAENALELRSNLLAAAMQCSERCLYQSAKWAAELSSSLANIPEDPDTDVDLPVEEAEKHSAPFVTVSPMNLDPTEARLEAQEQHKYLLAKSYFDCREYERCAAVFLPSARGPSPTAPPDVSKTSPFKLAKGKSKDIRHNPSNAPKNVLPNLSQKSLFLALYARYMAGEKRKIEDTEMVLGPLDNGAVVNKELIGIAASLEWWFNNRYKRSISGGWLEHLYGIVLVQNKNEEEAKRWLIRSVNACPFNWGAWTQLGSLVGSVDDLRKIVPELGQNIMTAIFSLWVNQELYQTTDEIDTLLLQLLGIFPESSFLKTQQAQLYHHAKDDERAEAVYSDILYKDPYRLDHLDHYSNLLYVMGLRPKLAFLAQVASATDKFRPETCCIVGNYYAMKSEHEKAVNYFRRALTLDRNCHSAWILMGHEYIELKNTHAAIESYRRAVDVNRRDYRAWNGLGLTYELLEMHLYALFYFQRAASLKPYDPKMWQAVGSSYEAIGRPTESIKAYKRALIAGTDFESANNTSSFGSGAMGGGDQPSGVMDPEILIRIAHLCVSLKDLASAKRFMELTVNQEEGLVGGDDDEEPVPSGGGVGVTTTTSKARMWLAKYAFKYRDYDKALELAEQLCQDGFDVEEAKALIRDIRSRKEMERAIRG